MSVANVAVTWTKGPMEANLLCLISDATWRDPLNMASFFDASRTQSLTTEDRACDSRDDRGTQNITALF
jgi:hypothetical protein